VATWTVTPARAPVSGTFRVPPSKSVHQRALALAVLADGVSRVEAADASGEPVEVAGDVVVFAAALSGLAGREVPATGAVVGAFSQAALGSSRANLTLRLGRNATGLRVATALAALRPLGARTLVTGDPRLRARPHGPLLAALRALGGHARRRPSGAVRVIARPLSPRPLALDATRSSQFATALMLAAPRFGGLDLVLEGVPVSRAYLRTTVATLEAFGVPASASAGRVRVAGTPPVAARIRVPPDASSAAVWWAAAARTGGDALVPGLAAEDAQPDVALLPVLARMGASIERTGGGDVRVRGPAGPLAGAGDVDLRDAPDLAPLVGALAAGAEGTTRVVGAPHLRAKESDRVASVVAAVRALGGDAVERPDGFEVRGRPLRGGVVAVRGDHRLALAFGVLGLAVEGVVLAGAEAVEKSYPGFLRDLARAAGTA
jgi:3-phosphoshikimate 1-carboxyvinyltransferase